MLLSLSLALGAPHHELTVTLDPAAGKLTAVDQAHGFESGAEFILHGGLSPSVHTKGWRLERVEDAETPAGVSNDPSRQTARNTEGEVPLETWRLVSKKKKPKFPVELRYSGEIVHALAQAGEEYQRSFSETPGTIQADGVFLARSSFWIPDFGESITYTLDTTVPDGWSVVSSGNPTETGWESLHPMDDTYLVAAKWDVTSTEVETPSGTRGIDIYLREPDPGLAFRYTAATERYLTLYENMLTPYPFERFALVENFWETGYGMPGFTLLGPEVIRFPWVLTSSYPHEVLHTWWGNSASVDPEGGNWSEGLTAYMADHLFARHRGQDHQYRRSTLKKFTDLAADQDFPLVDFLGRTSAATESIGYGKSLMFWHMIRRHIGEEAFLKGMADFHVAYAFKPAGFADLEPFLSEASGEDLKPFFEAWTTSVGAIDLSVEGIEASEADGAWHVKGAIAQKGAPKPGWIPLRITTDAGRYAFEGSVALDGKLSKFDIAIPKDAGKPLRVDVDPEFDVMRVLDPMEVPPALTSLYGEEKAVFVMPASADAEERAAWEALAAAWARPGEPEMIEDTAVDAPPAGAWVLGWSNKHGPAVAKRVAHTGAKLGKKGLAWEGENFGKDHAIVLVARSDDPERGLGWVTAGNVESIPGLARKLPHYTKYSLLAFADTAPDNVAKATWQATLSPLTLNLTKGELVAAKSVPKRPPLAEMPPRFDGETLLAEAVWHADPAREGRGVGSAGLKASTDRIVASLADIGIEAEQQVFEAEIDGKTVELTNVVATVPGNGRPLAPVVVMAHLDHLGMGESNARKGNEGKLHPGADDNASGVAVGLEVLRSMASEPARPRPVTFVFTTAEEHGLVGAKHWLSTTDAPFACVALDTVGRLAEAEKITIVGAETAKEFRFLFMGVGYTTGSKFGFAQPGMQASDNAACHEVGAPGVQLTTGANTDYHSPSDTLDKLDADGMVEVADATLEAVAYLAERTDPLTVQLGDQPVKTGESRKASLGTMPDFTFGGPGVRVADVMPDSAAKQAGLKAGDVLLKVDDQTVADLRAFSNVLKSKKPGDTVTVVYKRGQEEKSVKATLTAR